MYYLGTKYRSTFHYKIYRENKHVKTYGNCLCKENTQKSHGKTKHTKRILIIIGKFCTNICIYRWVTGDCLQNECYRAYM